jgi:hypothetical protein
VLAQIADHRISRTSELRQLREKNAKLKRLVAGLSLNSHILQEIVAKTVRPGARRELAGWAQQVHRLSQRRVAQLIPIERMTLCYEITATRRRPCGYVTRAVRQPCALRLPAADGAAQARRLGSERQADLPAVHRGGFDRANEEAEGSDAAAARGAGIGVAAEPRSGR